MTFGAMHLMGLDLQQVSIASLIIALGLLVDDPVVAGDAIKRELAAGQTRNVAAWLGPTKLATAILYATITNIVAYLPFLMLTGTMGQFLYSLPVVMTCSLVASRVVSMTFIPLLGFYLLRAKHEPSIAEPRPAVTPRRTTSAGVHTGHTATANAAPRRKAPDAAVGRVARKPIAGSGTRTQPAHIRPSTINKGPSTSPQLLPIREATQLPPSPAMKPSTTCTTIAAGVAAVLKVSSWA